MSWQWRPIEDLEADPKRIESTELTSLGQLWTEQRSELDSRGLLRMFLTRLQREWAIETGILERIYDIDRGVTRLLVERGLSEDIIGNDGSDRDPALVAQILRDHSDVAEGLIDFVGGGRELSTSYVKELHAALTRSQSTTEAIDQFGRTFEVELLRGAYKTLPNNPMRPDGSIHQYCPPEHVASEMDQLIGIHRDHDSKLVAPEVEASFLHHRFTQIHPFQDGNGRVARALASLVFLKAGWFAPVVRREDRDSYLDALELADRGDLGRLVSLFVKIQKRSLLQALSISDAVQRADRASDVVALIGEKSTSLHRQSRAETERLAMELQIATTQRLGSLVADLSKAVGQGTFRFFNDDNNQHPDEKSHWFRFQVLETAKDLDYFADLSSFHHWARLCLRNDETAQILISMHGVGRFNPSAVGVSACFFIREEDGLVMGPWTLCDELLIAEPREPKNEVLYRLGSWLEQCLVIGLEQWRQFAGLI